MPAISSAGERPRSDGGGGGGRGIATAATGGGAGAGAWSGAASERPFRTGAAIGRYLGGMLRELDGLHDRRRIAGDRARAETDHERRDVVVTAARVREIDELPRGLRGRLRPGDLEDVGRPDEIGETVRAEDEDVARDVRDRLGAHVDLDVLRDPERAKDLVRVGMLRGVLGADQVAIDHLLDHRMVARDLRDGARMNEIDAAVADVRDVDAARMDAAPRRRSIPAGSRPRWRAFPRRLALASSIASFSASRGDVPSGTPFTRSNDRLHRELGGLFATRVAAHSVADDREDAERASPRARSRPR